MRGRGFLHARLEPTGAPLFVKQTHCSRGAEAVVQISASLVSQSDPARRGSLGPRCAHCVVVTARPLALSVNRLSLARVATMSERPLPQEEGAGAGRRRPLRSLSCEEEHLLGSTGPHAEGWCRVFGRPQCPASQPEEFGCPAVDAAVVGVPASPAATSPWPRHLLGVRCSEGHRGCLTVASGPVSRSTDRWQPPPHVLRRNTGNTVKA